jgi:multiple sugar transport system permease protein
MRRRRWTRERVETAGLCVARIAGIVFFLGITVFPFYYMVLLSLRTTQDLLGHPGSIFVSLSHLDLDAYARVLKPTGEGGEGFLRFLLNSALVCAGTVALTIAIALPGAYAVSRLPFFAKRTVHFLFLAIYIFPTILLAIPLFVFFTRLGLRGSIAPLIIVYISQTLPVSIYMLRNYLDAVPRSIEEAALVDGCGRIGVILRISLPLVRPALIATALYVFMIAWNEYLFALLFLVEERSSWTVSLGVSQLSGIEVPTTALMAASVILTIPILVIFFFTERYLVAGLTAGGEKG